MPGAPDSVPGGGFRYLGFPGVAQTWADGSGGAVGSGSGADGEPANTLLPRLVSRQQLSRTHPRRRRALEKPARGGSGLQDSRTAEDKGEAPCREPASPAMARLASVSGASLAHDQTPPLSRCQRLLLPPRATAERGRNRRGRGFVAPEAFASAEGVADGYSR